MAQALTIPESWSRLALGGSGVAFICYAAATFTLAPNAHAEPTILLCSLVLAFWLGYFIRDLFWIWAAYGSFLITNLGFHLYYDYWGVYGNPNLFGCALAIGLASALAYRLWIFLPPVLGGLWLTQSRGAILGASAALFIWLWPKYKTTAFTMVALGLIGIIASQHGEADGVWQRLGIWQDTLNHLSVWGYGWGSFYDAYWAFPVKMNVGFARPDHAYNDFLELTFELGLGVIFLWTFLISVMSEGRSPAKLIVWAYFALALSFFPLWVWPIGPLVALALGNITRGEV